MVVFLPLNVWCRRTSGVNLTVRGFGSGGLAVVVSEYATEAVSGGEGGIVTRRGQHLRFQLTKVESPPGDVPDCANG